MPVHEWYNQPTVVVYPNELLAARLTSDCLSFVGGACWRCSNISPQVGSGFNRDYWARFEKFVKDVAKRADGVYIITGPLYLPSKDVDTGKWVMKHPMIGKAAVWGRVACEMLLPGDCKFT